MGFRSDVTSCIYGKAEVLTSFFTKHKLLDNSVFTSFFKDSITIDVYKVCPTEGEFKIILLQIEDVKWYDGYSDVDAWTRLLEEAGETDGLEWEHVECHEDGTSEQRRSDNSDFILSVSCSASVNY
jgi:hypothetical protein